MPSKISFIKWVIYRKMGNLKTFQVRNTGSPTQTISFQMDINDIIVNLLFLGNISSIIVLSCHEMQSNFNHLLIGLASFDLVYLLVSTLIFALPKLSKDYFEYVLPYVMPTG